MADREVSLINPSEEVESKPLVEGGRHQALIGNKRALTHCNKNSIN